ncbi:hypothetical protein [Prosthecobacter sp.]|uniref:hypothetical protein n=1 Tax=Prosthecobacter sp. TaxID=1965333 RepID=UPI001E07F2E4|nr:hypothetical protein [Prosthecobacter sp.]MCB1278413.1 hypothetical protein [Prosthecobacter sp.]
MIICLESSILGGYLSNEVPGLVTGVLHLAGQNQPVRVELVGNFLRDIAGCRVDFHNPLPDANQGHVDAIRPMQHGYSGLMTASYRVAKLPRRRLQSGGVMTAPVPPGLKNLLFFEWFNQDHQRILIQSWHLQLRVSSPRWQLTKDEESALLRQNRARRKHFLLGASRNSKSADALHSPGFDDPFQPTKAGSDPFGAVNNESSAEPPRKTPAKSRNDADLDPVARSAALAKELRRFQSLLVFNEEVRTRPAVLRLLSTVADLAAHLIHVLRQFAEAEKDQWQFLVVDLEQSLPLFAAALNATDKLVQQHPDGADMEWLAGVQASLLNIELRMRELLGLLRGP